MWVPSGRREALWHKTPTLACLNRRGRLASSLSLPVRVRGILAVLSQPIINEGDELVAGLGIFWGPAQKLRIMVCVRDG